MKSAYELAMERLNKTAPAQTLSAAQKRQIAELNSVYSAKLAEKELAAQAEIAQAEGAGDLETAEKARQRWATERAKLQADLEEKKEAVRGQ